VSAGPVGSNAGGLGPYTTSGNKILDKNKNEHFFRGLDRPSLEWSCSGDIQGVDYQGMSGWGANVVRLPLNQDCWLSTSGNTSYDSSYAGTVDQNVQWAKQNGMDIILDLHWSDKGNFSVGATCLANTSMNCQQDMADTNSTEFWKEVAGKYANDPAVIFELYNEPKIGGYMPQAADWNTWLNGGTSSGFTVVGMQSLYNTVRATGANNIVIIGGLNWAYDLTGVPSHAVSGTNIVYNTHPYANHGTSFTQYFGNLTSMFPVIATEFGDTSSGQPSACSATFDTNVLDYMDGVSGGIPHKMSWTAWAFYVANCNFPTLLADSNYDPNAPGMAVQSALMAGP
jgi:aryl-phospho-beta-D-glucosidase BglC (GH1 family)